MKLTNLRTHLHILQLEGYSSSRFLKWWITHPFTFKTSDKKPLKMTSKAKTLERISQGQFLLLLVSALKYHILFALVGGLSLVTFPTLLTGLLLMKPYEIFNKKNTIKRIREKILSYKKLTVIGITGSFGKTSTKDFLFEILNSYKNTVKTPLSYNTVFGISKVVDLEITKKTDFFLCEMGAYYKGDIKELCNEAAPKFAILTTIGSQHLERFKSLATTTSTKFELIDSVSPQNALVNLDNPHIAQRLELPKYKGVKTYSFLNKSADFYVSNYTLSSKGFRFTLNYNAKSYEFTSSLFGTSNLQNLIAAIGMAFILDTPYEVIKKAVFQLKPSPHRLELKPLGKSTLIDDAFSSNEQGFANVITDLSKLPGKKALVTPGIIELGNQTAAVHQRIGALSKEVFDSIVLEGKNERTTNLEKGLAPEYKGHVTYLTDSSKLWPTLNEFSSTHDWILLENDLPDNY